MNTLAHDVAPLLHYAITHCMLFRFSTHPQLYRIVICKNCTCTYTSKVAIGPEHMIPKTYPLVLSPTCTISCTLCKLKITVHFWARNVRSGSPPNGLHSSSNNHVRTQYNYWGEPERAPHDREVWCEGVQYICLSRTSRGQRCDIYACVIVTWAHTLRLYAYAIARLSTRLGSYGCYRIFSAQRGETTA